MYTSYLYIMISFHININTFQSPPDPLFGIYHINFAFPSFLGSKYHIVILNTFISSYIISYIISTFHNTSCIIPSSHTIFFVIYHIIISYNILSFRISYHQLTHISFYHIITSSFYISSFHTHFVFFITYHIMSSYHMSYNHLTHIVLSYHHIIYIYIIISCIISSYYHIFFLSYIIYTYFAKVIAYSKSLDYLLQSYI